MANDENKIILEFPATNVEIEFGETITFDNISGFLNSDRVTYNGESLTEEIAHLEDGKADKNNTYTKTQVDTITDTKMDKSNPTGTGTLNINRKAGTTVGEESVAFGYNSTASGEQSIAGGYSATASNTVSVALGNAANASGFAATAFGTSTRATGNYSHAEGNSSVAKGSTSHAEGHSTTASGDYSHAEGRETVASAYSSHAEGLHTQATQNYSHSEGCSTIASGHTSHAEGYETTASGDTSHAEGYETTASGTYSHAEGNNTTANSYSTHAEGDSTIASGDSSHAEGLSTTASGDYSHSEGFKTIANHKSQHVFGEYNVEDNSENEQSERGNYVEIVGNGYWDNEEEEAVRSNARTLDWNGNEVLAGDLTFNGSTSLAGEISRLDGRIDNLPAPMIFKGTLGVGGTIQSLPTASASNEGWTYKVITDGTYAGQTAKVGDVFTSNGSAWVYIPSGDEDNDTWRAIKVNGVEKLGNGISSGAVDFVGSENIDVEFDSNGNKVGIKAKNIYTKEESDDKFATKTALEEVSNEVENIRIGADGTTYASAGNAVRDQVDYLENGLMEIGKGKTYIDADWVVGAIVSNSSPAGVYVNTNITYRICTNEPIIIKANTVFHITSGYRIFIYLDDGTGKYVSEGGWRTGDYSLNNTNDISAYIMISKSPESSSDVAEINLYVSKILIDSDIQREINNLTEEKAEISSVINLGHGKTIIYDSSWARGSISTDNTKPSGIIIYNSINYRVCTNSPVLMLKNTVFYIASGYKIFLFIDDGTGKYVSYGSWLTGTFYLNNQENINVYIMIALETETQAMADIDLFVSSVLINTEFQTEINALNKNIAKELSDGVWSIGTGEMKIEIGLHSSKNGAFSYGYIDYNGNHLKNAEDDISPINLDDVYYVGANHGYYFIYKATLANHGLSLLDIGKTCTIDGKTWVLLQVNDEDTFTVGCYSSSNWFGLQLVDSIPTTFNFGSSITVTNIERGQLYPSIKNIYVNIVENSDKYFSVAESYDIIDLKSGIDALISNVGNNDNDSIASLSDSLITIRNLYVFDANASCTIYQTLKINKSVDVNFYGASQSMAFGNNDYFAVPMTSNDLLTIASALNETRFTRNTWDDQTKPPVIYIQANNNGPSSTAMMLQGFIVSDRNNKIYSEAGFIYTSKKMYPFAIEPRDTMNVGTTDMTSIRIPMYKNKMSSDVKYCGYAKAGNDYYLFCYNPTAVDATINLPIELLGKTVETLIAKNATCATNKIITGIDVAMTNEGYLWLKITD